MSTKKRVLVVDDSVFARKIVSDIIDGCPDLCVVGTAIDGFDALRKVQLLKPDVVTLDVQMPKMDGIETLKSIMSVSPTRVVMVSSLTTQGAKESMAALRLGAIDIVAKPHGTHSMGLTAQAHELIEKVLTAADAKLTSAPVACPPSNRPSRTPITSSDFPVVVIASSTGGPRALRMVIPALGDGDGAAYIVVQHLPPGFSKTLAQDLDGLSMMTVREAESGDIARPGEVLFAKSGFHLVLGRGRAIHLSLAPPMWGVRPSADMTMTSVAAAFGRRAVGVVLTGMGSDGAAGTRAIKDQGGATIAEHESTCVVYGMPRMAVETGAVDVVQPIDKIPDAISAAVFRTAQRLKLSA